MKCSCRSSSFPVSMKSNIIAARPGNAFEIPTLKLSAVELSNKTRCSLRSAKLCAFQPTASPHPVVVPQYPLQTELIPERTMRSSSVLPQRRTWSPSAVILSLTISSLSIDMKTVIYYSILRALFSSATAVAKTEKQRLPPKDWFTSRRLVSPSFVSC